mgnify:CR=1 FL=1
MSFIKAIWALGNISGDSHTFRDLILKQGGVNAMIKFMEGKTDLAIVKHGTWALSNFCRGKPAPRFELVKNAIPHFAKVLKTQEDVEVLTDVAWALSHLSGINENNCFSSL